MIDLKKLRRERKITQKELARQMGIAQSYLSGIERGRIGLSTNRIKRLRELFGDELSAYEVPLESFRPAQASPEAAPTPLPSKRRRGRLRKTDETDTAESKQRKFDRAYMRMARVWAELSHCKRKKVGALIVKDRKIISDGYNGTPTGFENCCEDTENRTKWYVLHAEANAILKIAASTQSCDGATLYVTMSPCRECSKLIHQAGIKRVVYLQGYSDTEGLDFLRTAGVQVEQLEGEKE